MAECIDVMAETFLALARGDTLLPLRTVVRLPESRNLFALMPALVGAGTTTGVTSLGAKIITVFPGNDATPYDSHIGVVLLFDTELGRLLAIMDASSITAIRTAAVSGLATRLMATPDAGDLALLGAGIQAMTHLDAIRAVRSVRRVRVWSRSPARATNFASRAARHATKVEVCGTAQEAVAGADIVCTVTSSREPVLKGEWLSPGTHVNAVGAALPTTRELDSEAVRRARLFVDRRESAINEAGDFLIPRDEGVITDDHILGELGDVLTGVVPAREDHTDITLFKSLGLAIEDVAAARRLYDKSVAMGTGVWISLGGLRHAD